MLEPLNCQVWNKCEKNEFNFCKDKFGSTIGWIFGKESLIKKSKYKVYNKFWEKKCRLNYWGYFRTICFERFFHIQGNHFDECKWWISSNHILLLQFLKWSKKLLSLWRLSSNTLQKEKHQTWKFFRELKSLIW